MVDNKLRHRLSQDLRRLITGRMSNDDFDDQYYDAYCISKDLAVREISRFGWSLYSSDLPMSYRLRGKYAVNDESRATAARAVLFLQTDLEYSYPETNETAGDALIGCAWFNGSLVGIAFLIIGCTAFQSRDPETAQACFFIGVGMITVCMILAGAQLGSQASFRSELGRTGDLEAWPFLDGSTLAKSNGNNYLLSNFKPKLGL